VASLSTLSYWARMFGSANRLYARSSVARSAGCVLLLQFHAAEAIGQAQFLERHVPWEAKQIVEGRLFCPGGVSVDSKEVVANHGARNVDGVDSELAGRDLNTHE
jgi:hypothetical protein